MKLIKQDKFSENVISFRYMMTLDKSTITAYNLLCYMVKAKTELFEDKNRISMEFNKNYGLRLSVGLTSYGNALCMQYRFQYIRNDWIEDDEYVKNIIRLMDQFLFHSVLSQETLDEAKFLLRNRLFMQKDDPMYESIMNAFTAIEGNHSISIPIYGSLEDIDSIQLEDVSLLLDEMKKEAPYVYACGIIDEEIKNYIESISNSNDFKGNYTILKDVDYKEVIEEKDIEQTCIAKVYATNVDPLSDEYYPLLLMNSVLGQSPINLLFQEVREKHSFCYSIGSSIIRFDGVLYVYVGCKREHINEILELIDVQIKRIMDMDYKDELLEIAKKDWKDAMIAGLDSQTSHIERSFLASYLQRSIPLEERMKQIDAVTKEDLANACRLLKPVCLSIIEEEA